MITAPGMIGVWYSHSKVDAIYYSRYMARATSMKIFVVPGGSSDPTGRELSCGAILRSPRHGIWEHEDHLLKGFISNNPATGQFPAAGPEWEKVDGEYYLGVVNIQVQSGLVRHRWM